PCGPSASKNSPSLTQAEAADKKILSREWTISLKITPLLREAPKETVLNLSGTNPLSPIWNFLRSETVKKTPCSAVSFSEQDNKQITRKNSELHLLFKIIY